MITRPLNFSIDFVLDASMSFWGTGTEFFLYIFYLFLTTEKKRHNDPSGRLLYKKIDCNKTIRMGILIVLTHFQGKHM